MKITMKRITSFLLIGILFATSFVKGDAYYNSHSPVSSIDRQVYIISDEDRIADQERQIRETLNQLGIEIHELGNVIASNARTIGQTRNDGLDDYQIVFSDYYYPVASGFASGQPTAGIHITTGGTIYYSDTGGSTVSVSVSFPLDFGGAVNVTLNLGRKTSTVSAYSVNIPDYGYWKLYVNNTYQVQKYIIYHREWVDDITGYVWREWSGGMTKTLYQVMLDPIRIS